MTNVFSKTDVTENELLQLKIKYNLLVPKLRCKVDVFKLPVQDTCVALQALSEYAILSYVGGVNLTISLASTNLDFQETFELNRDNQKLLQSAKVTTSMETVNNINDSFKAGMLLSVFVCRSGTTINLLCCCL